MQSPLPSHFSQLPVIAPSDISKTRNSDPNAVVVVVGASRGIGLGLVQKLLTRWKGKIAATTRNKEQSGALNALWQFAPERLLICDEVDVRKEESVEACAKQIVEFGSGRIDLLINCAGILHDKLESQSMPERNLSQITPEWMMENFAVNAIGAMNVAKHLSPYMVTSRKEDRVASILMTISARVGSISDNRLGGWYSYRISKAAQNQLSRTMSLELGRRGIIVVSYHPGSVDTDLSTPFRANIPSDKLFPVDFAAVKLLDVVDSLTMEDNGHFYDYAKKPIEW